MPDRTPRETALAYMEAWNAMDADGCAACFAEDGVREGRILARATAGGARFPRFVGREAIGERIRGFMVAVPDLRVDVLRVGRGPDDTAWLPAVSIYRVRDGLIAEETEYIDPAVLMTPPG